MRGSSPAGLFIVVLLIIIAAADGAKVCWVCGGDSGIDCKSPEKKDCPPTLSRGGGGKSAESGSPTAGSDKPAAPVSSPTEAPAASAVGAGGGRKKRDVDVDTTCVKDVNKDGSVEKFCSSVKIPGEFCDTVNGQTSCLCNSDLCNGSSLPKSISVWGLGLVAIFVVLHSSKLL